MPIYEYKALNSSGKTISGIIDADSSRSARTKLRHSGIYVTALKEETKTRTIKSSLSSSIFFSKVKVQDIALATRQLSTLISAGLPVVEALTALSEQTENPSLKKTFTNVREMVNEGSSLGDAIAKYPKYFSNIYINMVRAGESSGALDITLSELAEFSEKQLALQNKIKAAFAYPIIMVVVSSGVLYFLLAFVVPTITKMFAQTKATLPLPTIILIFLSSVLKKGWWAILLSLTGFAFAIKKYSQTNTGRAVIDNIKIKLPVIGGLIKKAAISRFARTLGVLIRSGIPILQSLDIVSAVVGNVIISDAIDMAKENIKEGEDIASPLKMSKLFPPMVIHMISIGERSGSLEKMLLKIADVYDGEVESTIQWMTSLLEPIMIVVMGGIIGFIVLAILMPIFEMNQLIR